ncbi:MAG: DUF2220 family protein [Legionella sp.]
MNHWQLGRNEIPSALWIYSSFDALAWLGKKKWIPLFLSLVNRVLDIFPQLQTWILKKPHRLLQLEHELPRLITIVDWLLHHPKPNIYLRQLSLPAIDTKFIEHHQKVLSEWFDLCLPEYAINKEMSATHHFALRYGFLEKPQLVRFRILDKSLYLHGLSDLSITTEAFTFLDLPVKTVFVIENDINALTFPDYPNALILFGCGYGFDFLSLTHWLNEKQVFYWGDIDTHGFAILNQFRKAIPNAQSLLMNEQTLLHHRAHWTKEAKPRTAALTHLYPVELNLYKALQENHFGEQVRLEQEYINYEYMLKQSIHL